MAREKLFSDFPAISSIEWREKIEADLKGADFNKLIWRTEEGFDVQPYYRREDLEKLSSKGATVQKDWLIRQDYRGNKTPAEWNGLLRKSFDLGIQSVGIDTRGMEASSQNIETLLNGIDFENLELNFQYPDDPLMFFKKLLEYLEKQATDIGSVRGSLGVDPLGKLAARGEYNESEFDQVAELIRESAILPQFRILNLEAGLFQEGGSTLSQELGYGLAMANETIDKLHEHGCSLQQIFQNLSFNFVTGPDYFLEIAKLRAARWLWSKLCEAWGVTGQPMRIHSRSACWNFTVYDATVNMLRTTTEAMSASLGGSDSISVLPYNRSFEEDQEFSFRIAKNTQIILKDEAHLNKVADPSAGSYYIEELTEMMADQAWKHFLEIEDKGGFIEAFRQGYIQEQTSSSAEKKRSKVAMRRRSILGVNQYPNFKELLIEQGLSLPAKEGIRKTAFQAIQKFRLAEDFEQLRFETEKSGQRPKVFLLKYGDPTWRTARAMFAGNFFACAGYEILDHPGFTAMDEALTLVKKQSPDILVLCSSDDSYKEIAAVANAEMKGSTQIVIAGYPAADMEALKEMGILHFIHMKSNLLEELKKFNEILGIATDL